MNYRVILTVNLSDYNLNEGVFDAFRDRYFRAAEIVDTITGVIVDTKDEYPEREASDDSDIEVVEDEVDEDEDDTNDAGIEIRFIEDSDVDASVLEQILSNFEDDEIRLIGITYNGISQGIIDALKSAKTKGYDKIDFKINDVLWDPPKPGDVIETEAPDSTLNEANAESLANSGDENNSDSTSSANAGSLSDLSSYTKYHSGQTSGAPSAFFHSSPSSSTSGASAQSAASSGEAPKPQSMDTGTDEKSNGNNDNDVAVGTTKGTKRSLSDSHSNSENFKRLRTDKTVVSASGPVNFVRSGSSETANANNSNVPETEAFSMESSKKESLPKPRV